MSSSAKKGKPRGAAPRAKKAAAVKKQKAKEQTKQVKEERPAKEVSAKKASPKAKAPAKKEAPQGTPGKAPSLHLGPPPSAAVSSRYLDSMKERGGRGFSFGELESAGVPLNVAKAQELSIDIRRRSILSNNVESLKTWLKAEAAPSEK